MMEQQCHQLDHMQIICTSLQRDNHASTSSLNFFTSRTLFLMPNQQCQSTEGNNSLVTHCKHTNCTTACTLENQEKQLQHCLHAKK